MDENQNYVTAPSNNNFLPISILIAAVLIAGSIFYVFGKGGATPGTGGKQFPNNAFAKCVDTNKYATQVQEDRTTAQNAGITGTPSSFVNGAFVNGAQPWSMFKAVIDTAIKNGTSTLVKHNAGDPTAAPIGPRDVILGDPNAPVTFIEYGDYQCPFCARFFTDVEPLIKDQYVKTGKVKMIFRSYPFLGNESVLAAQAAECAKDQGKFWEYHDALYTAESQDAHENNGNLNRDLFLTLAQNLHLDAK
jgi:protein-disulfide isomerase